MRLDAMTPSSVIDALIEETVIQARDAFREFVADHPEFFAGADLDAIEERVASLSREQSQRAHASLRRRCVQ